MENVSKLLMSAVLEDVALETLAGYPATSLPIIPFGMVFENSF